MKDWPDFNSEGDLPIEIHQATLSEVVEHLGGVLAKDAKSLKD